MPYTKTTVKEKIPGTKNLSDKQLGVFVTVVNQELDKGVAESKAIKMAYGAANKLEKSKLLKAFESFLDSVVGDVEGDKVLRKDALSEELMQETSVVYLPNTKDAHDNWMSTGTVAKVAEDLRKGFLEDKTLELNLWHTDFKIPRDEAEVLDVDLTKSEMWVGDKYIPEGTCVMTVQYYNERLWEMRKAGVIGGFSLHGKCNYAGVNK